MQCWYLMSGNVCAILVLDDCSTAIHAILVLDGCSAAMHGILVLDVCSKAMHAILVLDDCSAAMHAILVLDGCSSAMHVILVLGDCSAATHTSLFDISLLQRCVTLAILYALQPLRLETSFASFLCVPVYVCCGSKDSFGVSPRHSGT